MTVMLRCVCVCVDEMLYLIPNPSSPQCPERLLFIHMVPPPAVFELFFLFNVNFVFLKWSWQAFFCGFALSQYVIVLTILVKSLWETRFMTRETCTCLCTAAFWFVCTLTLWKSGLFWICHSKALYWYTFVFYSQEFYQFIIFSSSPPPPPKKSKPSEQIQTNRISPVLR